MDLLGAPSTLASGFLLFFVLCDGFSNQTGKVRIGEGLTNALAQNVAGHIGGIPAIQLRLHQLLQQIADERSRSDGERLRFDRVRFSSTHTNVIVR